MKDLDEIIIKIRNEWDIVAARQEGRQLAKELGFGEVDQARIATSISELARNIILYAGEGEIILQTIQNNTKEGIKVRAIDHGPGIKDITLALSDGYTTSNGLGSGLPGVKRLMDEFSIASKVGEGTIVETRKWKR